MKVYRLLLSALLLGGCVTVNNPTVNAAANTAIDATATVVAPIEVSAPGLDHAPIPSVAPTPTPVASPESAFTQYSDYTFSFEYPKTHQMRDMSMSEFARAAGIQGIERARGKTSIASREGSPHVLFLLVVDEETFDPPAPAPDPYLKKSPYILDGHRATIERSLRYQDGHSLHFSAVRISMNGIIYYLAVQSLDVDELKHHEMESAIFLSWRWKYGSVQVLPEPSVAGSTPTPTPAPTTDPCPALQQKLNADLNAVTIKYNKLLAELNGSLEPISSGLREARLKSLQDARAKELDQLKAAYTEKCPG